MRKFCSARGAGRAVRSEYVAVHGYFAGGAASGVAVRAFCRAVRADLGGGACRARVGQGSIAVAWDASRVDRKFCVDAARDGHIMRPRSNKGGAKLTAP